MTFIYHLPKPKFLPAYRLKGTESLAELLSKVKDSISAIIPSDGSTTADGRLADLLLNIEFLLKAGVAPFVPLGDHKLDECTNEIEAWLKYWHNKGLPDVFVETTETEYKIQFPNNVRASWSELLVALATEGVGSDGDIG